MGDGETTVSSFRHLVGKGVFTAFADPAFFAQARIGEGGRSLEWPGDLDFCADALWFKAHRKTPRTIAAADGRRGGRAPAPITAERDTACRRVDHPDQAAAAITAAGRFIDTITQLLHPA